MLGSVRFFFSFLLRIVPTVNCPTAKILEPDGTDTFFGGDEKSLRMLGICRGIYSARVNFLKSIFEIMKQFQITHRQLRRSMVEVRS